MREVNFIAVLLCNLFLQAQQAYFSSKPARGLIKARIGQDVTFNWNFTVEDGESLLLMKLEYSKTNQFESSAKRIAYKLKGTNQSISSAFKGRVSVTRTGALTLYNVSVNQRGFYRCTVSLEDQDDSFADKAQLLVGSPPVIHSSPPSEMKLLEDVHVVMSCEASGTPVPNVSWYRQSKYGWEKLGDRKIEIKNAKLTDSALYKCSATNFMGIEEKTVKLMVYERPRVTSFFHTAALDDTVYECDAITFTCEAHGNGPPVKNIYIFHEDRLVHRSVNTGRTTSGNTFLAAGSRRGRLRIAKVKKDHEGRYYCVAENEHGFGKNKTIDLKVFAAPKNCERKRTLHKTRTTKPQNNSTSPTVSDHPSPTSSVSSTRKERKVLGSYSNSQVARPSLLLLAMWICHYVFCCVSP